MTTPAPPAPVVPIVTISLLDVYTKQIELGASLGVIHEQLKAVQASRDDHENRIRALELDPRIRALEQGRAMLIGAAMVMSVLVSAGATWIGLVITHR